MMEFLRSCSLVRAWAPTYCNHGNLFMKVLMDIQTVISLQLL